MKATIPLLFFALHLPSVSSFLENPTTTTHASTPYPASLLPAFALPTTLSITYCDGCAWLPRSQWYTTDLLSTFYTRRVQSGLPPLIDSALLSISLIYPFCLPLAVSAWANLLYIHVGIAALISGNGNGSRVAFHYGRSHLERLS